MAKTEDAPKRPRKERKDNADKRRRQLLDATQRSIVANGLAKTTLATVANEAGLSQGVAVFYYKSKNGLLAEALRDLYDRYERNWRDALAKAGPDPLNQLLAMIEADFAPSICNPELLSIWFAFWGEQKFTPQYAEVSAEFEVRRSAAITGICQKLAGTDNAERGDQAGEWIDTLTDGFWQKLHLFPGSLDTARAIAQSKQFAAELFPEHAGRIR